MFTKMKNIDSAFRYVRGFTMLVIIGCVLICCFTVYKSFESVSQTRDKVYILANGKALEAYSSDRKDNVPVEARDHVRTFHKLFFTLDPDDKVIKTNITKALYMADESAKRIYDDLKENGFYSGIISGNISQTIQIDSVAIDIKEYPYRFSCYAKQNIIRTTSISKRNLITRGSLRNVSRSDNNPHGFLIERWETIENGDIGVENRK
ncbi:conjugative transposon protein TraK [Flavobacterium nitrogenifigens]|uniref:Bacteroides conjugative transposon TraK protein n=1 Tax=Flavobacterium nitrogenifigens TaxID=1617283 RepID=A0A521B503_9FLAO|nr:conjugative transposon protein TraK [Flavobacterium nitrogenifigens]KAF2334566.1 conjugative transposon protein TraK [Flavobacterium nitrogenifigens]SMO42172.1 Bacteroides conjugative transposon TraK protein [Flavobacterium nitrogenifigens]